MNAGRECYWNELYTIEVTGGANPNIVFYLNKVKGSVGSKVAIQLSDVDQFAIDLKRVKDAAEKRLGGGVEFIEDGDSARA